MLWRCIAVQVHEATVEAGAYPSPLNYGNFPKSVCTSVNEVREGLATLWCFLAFQLLAKRNNNLVI